MALIHQLMMRSRDMNRPRPQTKIDALEVSVTILDNAGRVAAGTIDPWGVPAMGALAERITDNEFLARVACLNYINGTSEEVMHNIVNEGIARGKDWLQHFNRQPAGTPTPEVEEARIILLPDRTGETP